MKKKKGKENHKIPIKKKDLNPHPLPLSLPLPSKTTEQEDIVTAGQRKINLIWEITQAFLAIFVTTSVTILGIVLSYQGRSDALAPFLTLILGIIIGFYFQRTNHTKIGGVGAKPTETETYVGR